MNLKKLINKEFATHKQLLIYWILELCTIALLLISSRILFLALAGGVLGFKNYIETLTLSRGFLNTTIPFMALILHMIARAYRLKAINDDKAKESINMISDGN
ncbi:hypothetical protein [Lacrimispora amygdalina]|uniref:hypothetical protein n=1 Tax=Lacrimispora amygdalina TaxID=253257 RepID=UPI000BE26A78|nr:hypothetical protein [Lacrimispora amygdalina]